MTPRKTPPIPASGEQPVPEGRAASAPAAPASAEQPAPTPRVLRTPRGELPLRKTVRHPSGATSSFYERASVAVITDDGVRARPDGQPASGRPLITGKRSGRVARSARVYRDSRPAERSSSWRAGRRGYSSRMA